MRVTIQFDGSSNPNPGRMGIGVVLDGPDGYHKEVSEALDGRGTSNVAEYRALIRGLEEAKAAGATELFIRGDSSLVIQQVLGRFRVKQPHLKPLHKRVLELMKEFADVEVQWVPREQNKMADALSYAPVASPAKAAAGGVGTKPAAREHSILCPLCGKPMTLSFQRFKDGSDHIRQECHTDGFQGYAPDTEPFRSLARGA
jgi:probable phosphoglycerate mutase